MILNLTKNNVISRHPVFAKNFLLRGRGMIGRAFTDFDALVFEGCNCIHTLFMGIRLDVLFVDRENTICALKPGLPPWRFLVRCGQAFTVIEMAEGAIAGTGVALGDKIDLNAEQAGQKMDKELREGLLSPAGTVVTFKESK